ncbi:MAG: hypothetical protein V1738_02670 [Patescibacteria group bacterium]
MIEWLSFLDSIVFYVLAWGPPLLCATTFALAFVHLVLSKIWEHLNEPRWSILLDERNRYSLGGGPYRSAMEQPDFVRMSLLALFGLTVSALFAKISAHIVRKADDVAQWFYEAWHAQLVQLTLRLGLAAATLALFFWGSAYLFSQTPDEVIELSFANGRILLITGIEMSRMWDVVFAPVAVALLVGSYWLPARLVFGPNDVSFGMKLFMTEYAIFGILVGSGAWSSGLEKTSFDCLTGASIAGLTAVVVFVIYEAVANARAFQKSGQLNPFQNINAYRGGIITLCGCVNIGAVAGLLSWGLPLGFAVGLAVGLVLAVLITSVTYLLAFIARLVTLFSVSP